jgi:hypothetical protein
LESDFDQFIDFIAYFSHELTTGTSPEYALVRTATYFGNQTPDFLRKVIREIIEGTKSFQKALIDFGRSFKDTKYSRLVELLGRFLEKGAKVGGERMLAIIKQVRKNNSIAKARKNLISGQRVKVIALSLVSSLVIGMVTALAPMLSFAFIGAEFVHPTPGSPTAFSFSILFALFFTVIITGYRLNQTVEGSSRVIFLNILIFSCSYILTNQLLLAFL